MSDNYSMRCIRVLRVESTVKEQTRGAERLTLELILFPTWLTIWHSRARQNKKGRWIWKWKQLKNICFHCFKKKLNAENPSLIKIWILKIILFRSNRIWSSGLRLSESVTQCSATVVSTPSRNQGRSAQSPSLLSERDMICFLLWVVGVVGVVFFNDKEGWFVPSFGALSEAVTPSESDNSDSVASSNSDTVYLRHAYEASPFPAQTIQHFSLSSYLIRSAH